MPLVSLLIEIMGKIRAKPTGRRGGRRLRTELSSIFNRNGENTTQEGKKAVALSWGTSIEGRGCLFHRMQNNMTCNSKCMLGGFTGHGVHVPS